MKRSKKAAVVVAVILVLAGAVICACSAAIIDFDFSKLNTVQTEKVNYEIKEPFSGVDLKSVNDSVVFLQSESGKNTVVCRENEKSKVELAVENGILNIKRIGDFSMGINFGDKSKMKADIEVYLSKNNFQSLNVIAEGGDVKISEGLEFSNLSVQSLSGAVECFAKVKNKLKITTASGDICADSILAKSIALESSSGKIELSNVSSASKVSIKAKSSDVELCNIKGTSAEIETSSGNVTCSNSVLTESLSVKTKSADVILNLCDADSIKAETESGNVSGTLLTPKSFETKTETGNIDVPSSKGNKICKAKTESGDIEFSVK